MNQTEQLMKDFPLNTPVKYSKTFSDIKTIRYGNVIGYALNRYSDSEEVILVVRWLYSLENGFNVRENVSAIHPANLEKL